MKEKISALMDGELDADSAVDVLRSLPGDTQLRDSWERWHLIRASLHQDLEVLSVSGVAGTVARQLQNEPTILSPRRRRFLPDRQQWSRWVGGVAIAASVATVSVVGMRFLNEIPGAGSVATQLLAQSGQPVRSGGLLRTSDEKWGAALPPQSALSSQERNNLNQYLVSHSEFNSAGRVNGMMPYVHIVGHDSEQ